MFSGDDSSRCKSSQRVCRDVQELWKRVLHHLFFRRCGRAGQLRCQSSQRVCNVLQLQILETELATALCSQLLRVCQSLVNCKHVRAGNERSHVDAQRADWDMSSTHEMYGVCTNDKSVVRRN